MTTEMLSVEGGEKVAGAPATTAGVQECSLSPGHHMTQCCNFSFFILFDMIAAIPHAFYFS